MLCDKLICATTAGMGKHHPTDHHSKKEAFVS
jgi:hypothetical protein